MVKTSLLTQTFFSGTITNCIHGLSFVVIWFGYSNGQLDPWSAGGVLETLTSDLPAVLIPNAAHHLDLRAKNPADTIDVVEARDAEKSFIGKLI